MDKVRNSGGDSTVAVFSIIAVVSVLSFLTIVALFVSVSDFPVYSLVGFVVVSALVAAGASFVAVRRQAEGSG